MSAAGVISGLFGVEGKVVLVTGGSRGIGRAIAGGFARAGARVYICGRDRVQCETAAAEIGADGACFAIQADLSTVDGRDRLASVLDEREGRLDVLVNNAGSTWHEEFVTYPEAGWDAVMDINLKAPFFLAQSLLPLLASGATRENPGRVINIGSIRGYLVPQRSSFAYSASKGAVHQLSRHLAAVLAPSRVTVNVIAPGLYEEQMAATAEQSHTVIPLGRKATPDDLVGAAIYLSSRAGAYLTGTVIPVEGGVGVVPN